VYSRREQIQKEVKETGTTNPRQSLEKRMKSNLKKRKRRVRRPRVRPLWHNPPSDIEREKKGMDVTASSFDVQGDLVQIMKDLPPEQLTPELKELFLPGWTHTDGSGTS